MGPLPQNVELINWILCLVNVITWDIIYTVVSAPQVPIVI